MKRISVAERANWRAYAEEVGFNFHTFDGEPYWDETAYYQFSLQQIEDDEYNQSNQGSYYGVAHKVREKVTEQANILVGGQLKPYQIRVKFILYFSFSRS